MRDSSCNPLTNGSVDRQVERGGGKTRDVIRIAVQFFLEYLATPAAAMRLAIDAVHDVPPGLTEFIDRMWDEPSHRVPTHQRGGRILSAIREIVFSFVAEGLHIALPGHEVHRPAGAEGININPRLTDAFALDSCIRSAIQSSDLLETWTEGLGSE
eukprot:63632-Pyramimonas_sp.AAC.1